MLSSAPPLVDGHTHVDQYEQDELPGVLERAKEAGVSLIVAAATTVDSARRIQLLADCYPLIRAGVGIHPMDLTGPIDAEVEAELRHLASHPSVVVWSETGLDYLPTSPDPALQREAFRTQIRLAREFELPLVIHSREAHEDVRAILRAEHAGEVGGAWHYFSGGPSLADEVLSLGFEVSFAKTLLRSEEIQAAAAHVPLERIVIETDAHPQPFKKHRERWTEPWQLHQIVAKLAEIKGIGFDDIARATTANYLRMLRGRIDAAQLRSR